MRLSRRALSGRMTRVLKFREFDGGAGLDFVEHGLKLRIVRLFALIADGLLQLAEVRARELAREQADLNFVEHVEKPASAANRTALSLKWPADILQR